MTHQRIVAGLAAVVASLVIAVAVMLGVSIVAERSPGAAERRLSSGMPEIIDGDTLRIDGRRIRLWGIDAPEMDTAAGRGAKRALVQLVHQHERIVCEPLGSDRWGRVVARCYGEASDARFVDLACLMVIMGMARDAPRYSQGYYAGRTECPRIKPFGEGGKP